MSRRRVGVGDEHVLTGPAGKEEGCGNGLREMRRIRVGQHRSASRHHGNPEAVCQCEIPDPCGLGQPANPVDLDVHHLADAPCRDPGHVMQRLETLVDRDDIACQSANRLAILQRFRGLFERHGQIGNRVHHRDGLGARPGPVDVIEDVVIGLAMRFEMADAGNVRLDIRADLGRVNAVSSVVVGTDQRQHLLRRSRRDRGRHGHIVGHDPAQKRGDRHPGRLARDVPAGDVQRRLCTQVPRQREVHDPVDHPGLARILPDQRRGQGLDARPDARTVGGQIARAPGRAFAPAGKACIRVDPDKGCVQCVEPQPPARQPVGRCQGQFLLPDGQGCDLHAGSATVG